MGRAGTATDSRKVCPKREIRLPNRISFGISIFRRTPLLDCPALSVCKHLCHRLGLCFLGRLRSSVLLRLCPIGASVAWQIGIIVHFSLSSDMDGVGVDQELVSHGLPLGQYGILTVEQSRRNSDCFDYGSLRRYFRRYPSQRGNCTSNHLVFQLAKCIQGSYISGRNRGIYLRLRCVLFIRFREPGSARTTRACTRKCLASREVEIGTRPQDFQAISWFNRECERRQTGPDCLARNRNPSPNTVGARRIL